MKSKETRARNQRDRDEIGPTLTVGFLQPGRANTWSLARHSPSQSASTHAAATDSETLQFERYGLKESATFYLNYFLFFSSS